MFKIVNNPKPGECCAYRCKNSCKKNDRFCAKHRHRYTKEVNPVNYVYDTLRCNAHRRGKLFTISKEYFIKFCEETGYLEKRGKTGKSASIDRIDPNKGYEEGNIQVLSLSANSSKMHSDKAPF